MSALAERAGISEAAAASFSSRVLTDVRLSSEAVTIDASSSSFQEGVEVAIFTSDMAVDSAPPSELVKTQPDVPFPPAIPSPQEVPQQVAVPSVFENATKDIILKPEIPKKNVLGIEWQFHPNFQQTRDIVGTMKISGGVVLPIKADVVGRGLEIVETNEGERYALVTHHVLNKPDDKLVWAHPGEKEVGATGKVEKQIIQRLSLEEAQALKFSTISDVVRKVEEEKFQVKQVSREDLNKGNRWYEEDLGHVSLGSAGGRTAMVRGTVVGKEYITTRTPGGVTHQEKKYIRLDPSRPALVDFAKQQGYEIIDGSTGKEIVITRDLDEEALARLEEDSNKTYDFRAEEMEQGADPVKLEMRQKYPYLDLPSTVIEGADKPVMFEQDPNFELVNIGPIPLEERVVGRITDENGNILREYSAKVLGRTVKVLEEGRVLEIDEYFPWNEDSQDMPKFAQRIIGSTGIEGVARRYIFVHDDTEIRLPVSGKYEEKQQEISIGQAVNEDHPRHIEEHAA